MAEITVTQGLVEDAKASTGDIAGPGAAVLSFTAVIVLTRYRLLKNVLTRIQTDLAVRRTLTPK